MCSASVLTPCPFTTEAFSDETAAVARLHEIYDRNTRFLRDEYLNLPSGALVEVMNSRVMMLWRKLENWLKKILKVEKCSLRYWNGYKR